MTTGFNSLKKHPSSRLFTVIISAMLLSTGANFSALAQSYQNNDYGFSHQQRPDKYQQPKLKSGRYCTHKAVASLKISNSSAAVSISGQYPDQRGYSGNPRRGFSGEGFSIIPVNKNTVRITQHQYGATRNFKRC